MIPVIKCDTIEGNESLVNKIQLDSSATYKMLYFDANLI